MYTYTYDNKYQYTGATWGAPNAASNTFSASSNNMFQERGISYDFNGNILKMQHTGSTGTLVDNFTYNYQSNTNRLQKVTNAVGNKTYGTYTYDEIGRLKIQTSATGTTTYVKYDVTGKIVGIFADAAFKTQLVGYGYDESGNRISRTDKTGTTYYVYDANGSVMAIYTQASTTATPVETEVPFYGSGRLGTYFVAAKNYVYELRDNVGSVRVAVNGTKVSGQADIYKYDDYYPYGSVAQSGGLTYRYDYQGAYAEKDPVTGYNNFELRMYDARIGRWLSTDPKNQFASPYEGMGNNPVVGSDPTGGYDWYRNDETGAVFWQAGSDASVTYDGQVYRDIGSTYDKQAAGLDFHYNQDQLVSITDLSTKDVVGGQKIPSNFYTSNGYSVSVNFGSNTSDNISPNRFIKKQLLTKFLKTADAIANKYGLESLTVSATTNGKHAPSSNHYVGSRGAIDISAIDGTSVTLLGRNDASFVCDLQTIIQNNVLGVRENYGPAMMMKSGTDHISDTTPAWVKLTTEHQNHLHWAFNY